MADPREQAISNISYGQPFIDPPVSASEEWTPIRYDAGQPDWMGPGAADSYQEALDDLDDYMREQAMREALTPRSFNRQGMLPDPLRQPFFPAEPPQQFQQMIDYYNQERLKEAQAIANRLMVSNAIA